MTEWLAALEAAPLFQYLRLSRWGYAAANTAHVASLALLYGSAVALDLRLMGLWKSLMRDSFVRALSGLAALALVATVLTGGLLFGVRASEYAVLPVFLAKLALILIAATHALLQHRRFGRALQNAGVRQARLAGATSLVLWTAALICGRLVAFA